VVLLQQKMEALTKQKQELEQLQGQLKTVKSDVEKREQEALRLHSVLSQCFQIDQQAEFSYIFTARCYASAVLAMSLCLSVTSQCSIKAAERIELVFGM